MKPFAAPSLHSRAGMTLIELVVVMAIVAILAGIAVQRFQRARVLTDAARVEYAIHAVEEAVMHHMVLDGRIPDGHYDGTDLDLFSDILEPREMTPTGDVSLALEVEDWGVSIAMIPTTSRGGEVLDIVQSHRPNVIQDGAMGMKVELWSYELLGPMTQGPAGRVDPSIQPGTPAAATAATAARQPATSPSTQQPATTPHTTHGLPASCYNPAGHIRNRPGCREG